MIAGDSFSSSPSDIWLTTSSVAGKLVCVAVWGAASICGVPQSWALVWDLRGGDDGGGDE
jgi:hypothetical protein